MIFSQIRDFRIFLINEIAIKSILLSFWKSILTNYPKKDKIHGYSSQNTINVAWQYSFQLFHFEICVELGCFVIRDFSQFAMTFCDELIANSEDYLYTISYMGGLLHIFVVPTVDIIKKLKLYFSF